MNVLPSSFLPTYIQVSHQHPYKWTIKALFYIHTLILVVIIEISKKEYYQTTQK